MFGGALPRGPRGHVDAGIGVTVPAGTPGLVAAHGVDHRDGHGARDRRGDDRVPAHAGHRGAGRDELPVRGPAGALPGRELLRHAAQPLHAPEARRSVTRSSGAATSPRRSIASRRALRSHVRLPPLAALGRDARAPPPGDAGATSTATSTIRRVRLANAGFTMPAVGRGARATRVAARRVRVPRLLRHGPPQREGGVPAYLGWFDGNPAHLDPLPPVAAAPRYVASMGGADAVLARGASRSTAATTAGSPRS